MSFWMWNTPATFCTLTNDLLRPFLDKSVVVYLDAIIVYIKMIEEHKKKLKEVFYAF